jgi:hypothetical protein
VVVVDDHGGVVERGGGGVVERGGGDKICRREGVPCGRVFRDPIFEEQRQSWNHIEADVDVLGMSFSASIDLLL